MKTQTKFFKQKDEFNQRWDEVIHVLVSSKSQVATFESQASPTYFFLGQVKSQAMSRQVL